MTLPLRLGILFLASSLALPLFVAPGAAQELKRAPHPWKLGYAKRLAEEKLERQEERERREKAMKRRSKERRNAAARPGGRGIHARPAKPGTPATVPPAAGRAARPWNTAIAVPPANVRVNDPTGDATFAGQSETSITGIGDHLIAAWNDGQGFLTTGDTQGWATSIDGGQTWVDRGTLPIPPGFSTFDWTSDPVLTVNEKSGAFYFSALCDLNSGAGAENGVAIVKGRWNGDTFDWGTPVVVRHVTYSSGDFIDKSWIVADSVSSRVFLSYSRFPAGLSRIEFQYADSALASFSGPQLISLNTDVENGWVQGSRPVVDGNGRLHVMYYLIGQFEADYYRVRTSTNGGVSFAPPVTAATIFTNFGTGAPGFNREIGVQFASIAVDRGQGPNRNRIYLAWPESIDWLDDVNALGNAGNKSEAEANNTALTATPAVIGQTLRGSVSATSDVDYYALSLTAGQHIIAAADSVQSGCVLLLQMVAGDGTTLLTKTTFDATINPSSQNPNGIPSGWPFTAPTTGVYYLRIERDAGTGAYRVRTGNADRDAERGRDQRDIFVATSDDGSTWSTPVRVNEDPVGYDNWLPEVTVAPDGGVYSAWYDFHDATATNGGRSHVYLARSGDGGVTWTTLGAVTEVSSAWPPNTSNIIPNQGDYIALFANDSHVWPVWADMRNGNPDVYAARIPLIPNGILVAFQAVRLGDRRISVDWSATAPDTVSMRLYRSTDGGPFQNLDVVMFQNGVATFTDTTVVGNHTYSYRLSQFVNGTEVFQGQVTVFLPLVFPFSISAPRPNPVVGGAFGVSFSLATNDPAEIVLYDVSGREVYRRDVSLGQGPHTLTLPVESRLHQGLYVMTLRQGGQKTSTRFHLVR